MGARFIGAVLALCLLSGGAATAQTMRDMATYVDTGAQTLIRFKNVPGYYETIAPSIQKAQGILVVPRFTRAGLLIGGMRGHGMMVVRGPGGRLLGPAFFEVLGGGLGLQIGYQTSAALFLMNSHDAVRQVLENGFNGGAAINVSFGENGSGYGAHMDTEGSGITAFYEGSKGVFAGGSLESMSFRPITNFNEAIYGRGVQPSNILVDGRASTPLVEPIARALMTW